MDLVGDDAPPPSAVPVFAAAGSKTQMQIATSPGTGDNSAEAGAQSEERPIEQQQQQQDVTPPPSLQQPSAPTSSTVGAKDGNELLNKVFEFLSTATPSTLGAVAVGLASVTYFVLGQLGLLLIGAFGGIVLFASWEARSPEVSRAVKGEKGVDILARLLAVGRGASEHGSETHSQEEEEQTLVRTFADFQPETQAALNELVDAIIRDYIDWWYKPIVPLDRFFSLSCRRALTSFLLSISNHLGRKRPADAFLDFLTNSSSLIIVLFSELSNAFADIPAESKMATADVVYNYLSSNPESRLSNLLSQRQQAGKFRIVAEDLLGFLDRQMHDCDPARTFLREILAGVILETTLQTCSKPEWINGWIVFLLEAGEPDFSQAIDVGMQTGPELNNAFVDIDGNVGNIGLSKGNRNSFEMEKARRKEAMSHKKKLSKADEEMEEAMEEMKRMNEMIAKEDARRAREQKAADAQQKPSSPAKVQADGLGIHQGKPEKAVTIMEQQRDSADRIRSKENSSDGASTKGETIYTPITPRSSTTGSRNEELSPTQDSAASFTSFEQLGPPTRYDGESSDGGETRKPPPLTLHNAKITIHDEPISGEGRIRNKPSWDYLIQIEPANPQHPGWMIVRRYADFEKLHEIIRRIAAISGATAFTEQHNELPSWKIHTRGSLRGELERYVREACWYRSLAESEGMKRFLEKDQTNTLPANKSGLQVLENVGKNVFDVLTNAPKGVTEGFAGGMSGVFGNLGLGPKKSVSLSSPPDVHPISNRMSMPTPPPVDTMSALNGSARKSRDSLDSQQSSVISAQPSKIAPMERRPSYQSIGESEGSLQPQRVDRWDRASPTARSSRDHSRASSMAAIRSPSTTSLDGMRLPPPPDEMPDSYESSPVTSEMPLRLNENLMQPSLHARASSTSPGRSLTANFRRTKSLPANGALIRPGPRHYSQLSEQETRVAVELLFAVINELYTLSSAWNIRRTLLAAAKSFLLRPGNPSLVSIQSLMQASVIDANTSDSGIATHLRKLRENTLPTDEERATWPAELTPEEKEQLRIKARRLLIRSGVPAALMGVMGQSATSEALGRVFDCLQIEEVARGVIFGIMLQAVRIITH